MNIEKIEKIPITIKKNESSAPLQRYREAGIKTKRILPIKDDVVPVSRDKKISQFFSQDQENEINKIEEKEIPTEKKKVKKTFSFSWKEKSKKEKVAPSEIRKRKHIFTSLIPSEEKEYFIENLAMLLSSGMDILACLDAIKKEVKSSQMKAVISNLNEDVEAGWPIWKVLKETKFFPAFIISLIKIGEKSGGLVKNLKVIAIQQKKIVHSLPKFVLL